MLELLLLLLLLAALPLAGIAVAGYPPERYLEFPPRTIYTAHTGFSLPVFCAFAGAIALCAAPLILRTVQNQKRPRACCGAAGWPWWGTAGAVFLLAAWAAAWTRIPALSALQPHTFFPLWLGYILVMNALCQRRNGTCPLLRAPGAYLRLFPISAVFWWSFEYLNRFVQNWSYLNVERFSTLEYLLFASLSFSTVLPAVWVTQELLVSHDRLDAFADFVRLPQRLPRAAAWAALLTGLAVLAAVGVFPNQLFPALWVLPLLLLISLQRLLGRATILAPAVHGDWRSVAAWAAAALVCGFFWEMWNYFSLCKWTYHVPYVQALHVFEMPLLGYAGYLPFGVSCGAVVAAGSPRSHAVGSSGA